MEVDVLGEKRRVGVGRYSWWVARLTAVSVCLGERNQTSLSRLLENVAKRRISVDVAKSRIPAYDRQMV